IPLKHGRPLPQPQGNPGSISSGHRPHFPRPCLAAAVVFWLSSHAIPPRLLKLVSRSRGTVSAALFASRRMTDLPRVLFLILLLAAFTLGERLYRGLIRREPRQDRIGDLMTRARRLRADGDEAGAKAAQHKAHQIHLQNY